MNTRAKVKKLIPDASLYLMSQNKEWITVFIFSKHQLKSEISIDFSTGVINNWARFI